MNAAADSAVPVDGARTRTAAIAGAMAALVAACVAGLLALASPATAAPSLAVSVTGDDSETQMVYTQGTGGSFRLRFGDGGPGVAETWDLPVAANHATAATAMRDALNALTNVSVGGGSVSVKAGTDAGGGYGTAYRITFNGGPLAGVDVPQLVAVEGSTPVVSSYPDSLEVVTIEPAGVRRGDARLDYSIGVRNEASSSPAVGDVLTCVGEETSVGLPKNWNPGAPGDVGFPTFTYEWARNGVTMPSAASRTYTLAAADAGAVVQCLVKGTNAAAAAKYSALPAAVVAPVPTIAPPASESPTFASSRPAVTPTTGVGMRTCTTSAMNWTGTPTFTFQWLRNGEEIAGATSSTYTPVAEDTGTQLQCRVVGTNAGGSLIGLSNHTAVGTVTGGPNLGVAQTPVVQFSNITSGVVVLEIELPGGFDTSVVTASGTGWSCLTESAVEEAPAKVVCTRSDVLAPQVSYPDVSISVGLGAGLPNPAALTAKVSGGGALDATTEDQFTILPSLSFGLTAGTMATELLDAAGADSTRAGAHPAAAIARVGLNSRRMLAGLGGKEAYFLYDRRGPIEMVKQLRTDPPPGFVGNPLAVTELCDDPAKLTTEPMGCPAGSVVGVAMYQGSGSGTTTVGTVWNRSTLVALEPEPGVAAQFAFGVTTTRAVYVVNARLRPEDGYAVSIDTAPILKSIPFTGLGATICGYGGKVEGLSDAFAGCKDKDDPSAFDKPFLTNPTACSGKSLITRMAANSWQQPGIFSTLSVDEPAVTNCEDVPFSPSASMSLAATSAGSPSGLDASISIPDGGLNDPDGVSQAHLKKTVVELPDGVSVNPSAATGLRGCSDAQLGLGTDSEPACPNASKLGTVTATTPVLKETLTGVMVLRTPESTDPMSGEMFRMALIVRSDERGILVKLPGSATADPQTGRLVATFDDNPQLPIGEVDVKVRGGQHGVLGMPQDCGEVQTTTKLLPWSRAYLPVGQQSPTTAVDEHVIDGGCDGGFAPTLSAGNSDSRARGQGGTYSFRFSREDGEQWLRGLTAKLPNGLLASVRDVPLCSNGAADAGNCPAVSRIGVADAKAGAGDPFVLEEKGEVFLTEGYKGGEYGLAVKVRPVAGPFRGEHELSPIIVRQSIHVDRTTAQVTAVSDPFPLVHHGVPLRVREVNVLVNRGGFMLNPSDCAAKQTSAALMSDEGATANLTDAFQVSDCRDLAFKPELALSVAGRNQVTTGKHPGIRAQVTQAGTSEAGIEKAVVRLPKSLALDVNNAQALCEFVDGTKPDLENHCPKGSIVGRARAKTPLLKDDLVGNVYFVKNVRKDPKTGNEIRTLPMIIVALRGEIAVNLKGESDTTKSGKLVSTFASVPDAPVSKFNLNINGGKNGILAVTRTRRAKINLCARPNSHIAESDIDGHNGRRHDTDIRMKTPCTKKQVKRAKKAARRAANKAPRLARGGR